MLESLELEPERFTVGLVTGVEQDMATIDAAIDELTPDWPLERMPRLDLALLRIGYCELDRYRNTPVAVIIDEAVELAKQYSTDSSPRFVNGVLGRLAERLRGQ